MLLDFGIAKEVDGATDGMTKTGMRMGTEIYMAPEQLDAKHVGPKVDQYALALMVYEFLSGCLPDTS